MRLPAAPPSSIPNSTAQATDRMRRANTMMSTTAADAMIAMIQVYPLPMENAAPEFST